MAVKDVSWHMHKGVWQRTVGGLHVWAFVRLVTGGYDIATGTNGKPDKWEYYCDGGTAEQEYKAKRRATALARKLSKGG